MASQVLHEAAERTTGDEDNGDRGSPTNRSPPHRGKVDGGMAVADVCRPMRISEATFYVWKKKYAYLGSTEIRELCQLREKKAKLKRLAADLSRDKHLLAEYLICDDHANARRCSVAPGR